MKKFLPLFLVFSFQLLVFNSLSAQDFDFSKKVGGNTLYFFITSTGGKNGPTVEVTYPGVSEDAPWKGFRKPSGQLTIPETVTPNRSKNPDDDDTTVYRVTSIRYNAFMGCSRIKKLILPPSLESVGESAFSGCTRIGSIVTQTVVPPKLSESSFHGVDLEIPVHVLAGTLQNYQQAVGWRQFVQLTEF